MLITRIHNVLTAAQLAKVRAILAGSAFIDGRVSGGSVTSKHNLEMASDDERYVEILGIVDAAVRENAEFRLTAFPRYITRPIISRYETGMYYKEHVDMPVMGFMGAAKSPSRTLGAYGQGFVRSDLSMTVFLSDPDSYDGGELTFEGPTGPLRTKLSAGSGLLYPTGTRHCVTPVTRGTRFGAIFWIQSLFQTEAHRQAVCDARQLYDLLRAKEPDGPESALAEQSFFNLCRIFAQV
jgi:PKHD-type hydroxylase